MPRLQIEDIAFRLHTPRRRLANESGSSAKKTGGWAIIRRITPRRWRWEVRHLIRTCRSRKLRPAPDNADLKDALEVTMGRLVCSGRLRLLHAAASAKER